MDKRLEKAIIEGNKIYYKAESERASKERQEAEAQKAQFDILVQGQKKFLPEIFKLITEKQSQGTKSIWLIGSSSHYNLAALAFVLREVEGLSVKYDNGKYGYNGESLAHQNESLTISW